MDAQELLPRNNVQLLHFLLRIRLIKEKICRNDCPCCFSSPKLIIQSWKLDQLFHLAPTRFYHPTRPSYSNNQISKVGNCINENILFSYFFLFISQSFPPPSKITGLAKQLVSERTILNSSGTIYGVVSYILRIFQAS